jgi:hypothetical protein
LWGNFPYDVGMASEQDGESRAAAHFLRRRDMWIRWIVESDLTLVARVVGVHLAMRMNVRDQMAWPNVQTMAKLISRSPRQVTRAIVELEEFGALYVARAKGKGSRYYLRLPTDP